MLDLSYERHMLGIPGKAKSAVRRVRKITRDILRKKKWQKLLVATKQIVSIAAELPLPDLPLSELLAYTGYSPPLVDLSSLKTAEKTYLESSPEYLTEALDPEECIEKGVAKESLQLEWTDYHDEVFPDFSFPDLAIVTPPRDLLRPTSDFRQKEHKGDVICLVECPHCTGILKVPLLGTDKDARYVLCVDFNDLPPSGTGIFLPCPSCNHRIRVHFLRDDITEMI